MLASPPLPLLAQAAQPSGSQAAQVGMWVGLLIVLVVVGSIVVVALRRRMLSKDDVASEVLTLSDLRTMRDKGLLSTEEYDAMRARMTQRAKDAALNDPKVRAQLDALRGKNSAKKS
jgi:hypothetical protein